MFERYTEKARRVIFFARFEASQFGASQIEAEHILLGMLREDRQIAARFFPEDSPDFKLIRKHIEDRVGIGEREVTSNVDLPLSIEAKRVLAFAAQESDKLGHSHIGTDHLLLGLLVEEGTIAFKLLTEMGVVLYDVRKVIEENKLKNVRADSRYL
jgi:ATP-dependent Clp protease ATP-binding subunit ClpC